MPATSRLVVELVCYLGHSFKSEFVLSEGRLGTDMDDGPNPTCQGAGLPQASEWPFDAPRRHVGQLFSLLP